MPVWDDLIKVSDQMIFRRAGYGGKVRPRRRPALLVIDVTTAFVGDRPEPILKSIERFPNSCGEAGWRAVHKIKELMQAARSRSVPVIYTAGVRSSKAEAGMWAEKHKRVLEATDGIYNTVESVPNEIKPQPGDIIISKLKPSAFFGTPLVAQLVSLGIDTLLVTGCTTSGCVRASVVDAFSYNYPTLVVEECVFDRFEISHKVNLFDINQKYASVISLSEAKAYLASLQGRAVRKGNKV
ncbi:MAG: isochorismatase family protein [Thaumarchaeota archaeon]|nr:isochorismatase family protein [Nitrososphaerota archaeon]